MESSLIIDHIQLRFNKLLSIIEQLHSRDGESFKIQLDKKPMILKMGHSYERIHLLKKEVRILNDIEESFEVESGHIHSSYWILRPWISGKNAWKHCSYIHENTLDFPTKKRFISDLIRMLRAVMSLQTRGYLHGDLQPNHFLFNRSGAVRLIDLESCVKIGQFPTDYRGALVHFVSPETAQGMITGNTSILLDPVSEVYSFGAVAFFLYTDSSPVDYGTNDSSFEMKLKAIMEGNVRSFNQVQAKPFPELESILLKCLDNDRNKRYQSFDTLHTDLVNLVRNAI